MTEVRSSALRRRLARAVRGVRRAVAPDAEGQVRESERELRTLRRRLRKTRAQLARARAELDAAPYELPPEVEQTIRRVREEQLTYLDERNLRVLAWLVHDIERRELPGLILEAGTARGGSAIVMAAAKSAERGMKVYDAFGMIPPPGEHDGPDVHARYQRIVSGEAKGVGGETYYGYRENLLEEVRSSFGRLGVPPAERNVDLVKGLFEQTVVLDEPVALAHLDGDWYESTMTCLTRIAPLLVDGGRIVLDDYYMWSGCRAAVDEFLEGHDGLRREERARLHLVREPA
jgi:hypothetical protein